MNIRVKAWALLMITAFCNSAQAGSPPTALADPRNVSGLETGDAGQSIKPPPAGKRATTAAAIQSSGLAPVWPGGFTIGLTSVVLGPFFVCAYQTGPSPVSKPDINR